MDAEDIIQVVRLNDVLKTENVDSDDIIYVVHKTDSKAQESSENLPGEEVYSSEPVDSVMPSESDETDEFDYGKVEPAVSNEK